MNTLRYIVIAGSIAVLVAGCAPTAEPIAAIMPEPPKTSSAKPVVEAPPVVDEPDEETLLATRSVKENCLICHSVEIIESQRLTAKQWKAEIEKMVGWGSPLPVEQHEGVIKWLSANYSDKAARSNPTTWTLAEAESTIAPEPETRGEVKTNLAAAEANFAANCKNCHGANGEGSNLGPNLVERPVLLRPTDFLDSIKKGRGKMPMLGVIVNEQASREILEWLRTKRFAMARP